MAKLTGTKISNVIRPTGGVDEYHDRYLLSDSRLQAAQNVHIDGGAVFKRPGRRYWGAQFTNTPIRGIGLYIDNDGTERVLIAHAGSIWDCTTYDTAGVTSGTKTARDAGLDDVRTRFTVTRGRCFVNGAGVQRKIIMPYIVSGNATVSGPVGLPAPSFTPVAVVEATAGALAGTYSYKVTNVIESGGVKVWESNPSEASNSVTPASQAVSITLSSDSTPFLSHRYIYRTLASGATYYYVGKVAGAGDTAFTDYGAVTDATVGDIVEQTHRQPTASEICEGCNERLFWANGQYVYYSEAAYTDAYLEYAPSLNYWRLPGNGRATGLCRKYNQNSGREDLYIFQEDAISVLPSGDPTQSLRVIERGIGCEQHDTIKAYGDYVVFLSTRSSVCAIYNGRVIDISTRSIKDSADAWVNRTTYSAALLYSHYYALCTRHDGGKAYGHRTWVCDLRTLAEEQQGKATATWFSWDINADYLIQRQDGSILAVDNNLVNGDSAGSPRMWQYSLAWDGDGTHPVNSETAFTSYITTPAFTLGDILAQKRPIVLSILGRAERTITVTPIVYKTTALTAISLNPIEAAFVVGSDVMGETLTKEKDRLEITLPPNVAGNAFAFKISSAQNDAYFEIDGYQFTYQAFTRGR
jgi:hypothetical protein